MQALFAAAKDQLSGVLDKRVSCAVGPAASSDHL